MCQEIGLQYIDRLDWGAPLFSPLDNEEVQVVHIPSRRLKWPETLTLEARHPTYVPNLAVLIHGSRSY
jgi:hypothetical protein